MEIANHTVVLLDAPGLVEEERQRKASGLSFTNWAAAHPHGSIAFAQYAADMSRTFVLATLDCSFGDPTSRDEKSADRAVYTYPTVPSSRYFLWSTQRARDYP